MDTLEKLKDLAISESGFVFDPHSGGMFSANQSAVIILKALQQNQGQVQILATLAEKFDAADADLEHDIDVFIALMKQESIVPADFAISGRKEGVSVPAKREGAE